MSSKKYDDVSIYFDKTRNRYDAKITIEKGKPRKTVHGKTEEEAVLNARKLLYGTRDEKFIVSKGMPLIELLRFNLERKDKAGTIKPPQFIRTTYIIKSIEKYEISSKNITDLTENDLQQLFNTLAKEYSQSTLDKCYTEVNNAYKYAVRKNFVKYNTLEDIIKPKSRKSEKDVKALTIEQQKKLSDYLFNIPIEKYKYKNVLIIQMYMGLRIGEALALQKEDINLKNNTIHIQRTITQDRNKHFILGKVPKTDAGNRVLPIPEIILPFIQEQVKISENQQKHLLFVNNDNPVRHTSINDQLQRRLLNLHIYEEDIGTHSLRHTYATRCIESGMQAIVLSKLLGHADIRITLDTYVKVFNEYKTKRSKEVESYYKELEFNFNKTKENENIQNTNGKIIQFPVKYIKDFDYSER